MFFPSASGRMPGRALRVEKAIRMSRSLIRVFDLLAVAVIALAIYRFVLAPRIFRAFPPKPAPAIRLREASGGTFSLRRLRGHVVFLDFWASWCEPCKQSMPLVDRFVQTHPGAVVVSIDEGEDPKVVRAFVRTHSVHDVVFDPDSIAANAFAIEGYPTMVVVDPGGIERAKWAGFNPALESMMSRAQAQYADRRLTLAN
jgi:cytochrome c biogenesis protein CcmG, thiol:disulfide interchange protein DsbE